MMKMKEKENMIRKLGKTDLKITSIIYGCMGTSGAFGQQEEKDSLEALREAYNAGINCFDTSEMYGNGYSEQLLKKALSDKRQELVIIDKVAPGHMKASDMEEACNRSLMNLGTDYIDLYLLHWPVYDVPIQERVETLEKLKKEGKIRYYGVSNFGPQNMDEIAPVGDIKVNEVSYNLLVRACESEVAPRCLERNVPILCYSSLMQGLLAGKYQSLSEFPDNRARTKMFNSQTHSQCRHGGPGAEAEGEEALKAIWALVKETGLTMEELDVGWLKAQKAVGGVIVGTRNAEQSKALGKLLAIELDQKLIDRLSAATDKLKVALGPSVDMWDYRSR